MLFVYKYLTGKYYCNIIFIVTTTNRAREIFIFHHSGIDDSFINRHKLIDYELC